MRRDAERQRRSLARARRRARAAARRAKCRRAARTAHHRHAQLCRTAAPPHQHADSAAETAPIAAARQRGGRRMRHGSRRCPSSATTSPRRSSSSVKVGVCPDLGSEWRARQKEAASAGRFIATALPLYDPARAAAAFRSVHEPRAAAARLHRAVSAALRPPLARLTNALGAQRAQPSVLRFDGSRGRRRAIGVEWALGVSVVRQALERRTGLANVRPELAQPLGVAPPRSL